MPYGEHIKEAFLLAFSALAFKRPLILWSRMDKIILKCVYTRHITWHKFDFYIHMDITFAERIRYALNVSLIFFPSRSSGYICFCTKCNCFRRMTFRHFAPYFFIGIYLFS